MRFLFTDNEWFQIEVYAGSFQGAIRKAKSAFGIKCKVVCIEHFSSFGDEIKSYQSTSSQYQFTLRLPVDQ